MTNGSGRPGDDRYIVVAADSHVGPALEHYRQYCPRKHLEVFDEQLAAVQAQREGGLSFADVARRAFGYEIDSAVVAAVDRANACEGGFDPSARHRDMDADGVAADVVFHGLQNGEPMPLVREGLFQSASAEPTELDAVGYHIYNRWVADFVSTAPERHAALAYVPYHDVDAAIEELTWARSAGLRGVNFPAPKRGRIDYTDPTLDRFFAACADLEMPLTTHNGGGDRFAYVDQTLGMAFQKIEGPFMVQRGVWQLIFAGVLDRHPRLKVVLTELVHTYWIPEMLRTMDSAAMDPLNPGLWDRMERLPSEYWDVNFYVGASFMSHDEARRFPSYGTGSIMWGSDYPHVEGTHPHTSDAMRKTFAGIAPDHVARMIGLTAVEAYGLDRDRLRTVADRIGPTVESLSAPPREEPGFDYVGLGFRDATDWPADALASHRRRVDDYRARSST